MHFPSLPLNAKMVHELCGHCAEKKFQMNFKYILIIVLLHLKPCSGDSSATVGKFYTKNYLFKKRSEIEFFGGFFSPQLSSLYFSVHFTEQIVEKCHMF